VMSLAAPGGQFVCQVFLRLKALTASMASYLHQ
jgi:hypothetical protein